MGGAVYWYGADGVLSGSNFTDNEAFDGDAIYWYYGTGGVVSSSNFINDAILIDSNENFASSSKLNTIVDSAFYAPSKDYVSINVFRAKVNLTRNYIQW